MNGGIPGSVVEDDCLVVLLDAVLFLNELQPLLRRGVEAYFVSSCTRQRTRIRMTPRQTEKRLVGRSPHEELPTVQLAGILRIIINDLLPMLLLKDHQNLHGRG